MHSAFDRTMVTAHNPTPNVHTPQYLSIGHQDIVDSPANIGLPRPSSSAPPRVLDLVRVQVPIAVDQARFG